MNKYQFEDVPLMLRRCKERSPLITIVGAKGLRIWDLGQSAKVWRNDFRISTTFTYTSYSSFEFKRRLRKHLKLELKNGEWLVSANSEVDKYQYGFVQNKS